MKRPWRDDSKETPAQWIARAPLWPLAWLWCGAAALHRALYEWGFWQPRQLRGGVVSVGALQAGGTGKTPVAIAVARALREHRARSGGAAPVVLASRGYGRRRSRRGEVVCVSNGREIAADTERAGDEALLLATQAPGIPVYVARDRSLVGDAIEDARDADAEEGAFSLVLDDGFQHHRLARDVDLVVIDAAAGLGRACLPRGTRREGLRALRRADALVVLDPPLAPRDRVILERRLPALPRFYGRRRFGEPRPLGRAAPAGPFARLRGGREAGRRSAPTLAELAGSALGVFSGIGRPASLRESAEALGATVVAERTFRDHHRYRAADFHGDWLESAPMWLTTAKDALKLRESWLRGVPVFVLDMHVELAQPGAFARWLGERIARP